MRAVNSTAAGKWMTSSGQLRNGKGPRGVNLGADMVMTLNCALSTM
jgi:hypothetical protein